VAAACCACGRAGHAAGGYSRPVSELSGHLGTRLSSGRQLPRSHQLKCLQQDQCIGSADTGCQLQDECSCIFARPASMVCVIS
jgi:hypothetical protein